MIDPMRNSFWGCSSSKPVKKKNGIRSIWLMS